MALGEFQSQKALWQHIPNNVVVPLSHGTCKSDNSKSFFLASFRKFINGSLPTTHTLVELLKALHTSAISSTGKFGFHVMTFNGYVPLVNDWCDTWEEWYSRQLRSDMEHEQRVRGHDAEFMQIANEFFAKVIPRLLRPLETGDRTITPVLVHGDLWYENVAIDEHSGEAILFDSCCCYAHHESMSFFLDPEPCRIGVSSSTKTLTVELFMIRAPRHIFSNKVHGARYIEAMGRSEPTEDFDDRNALYAL